MRRAKVPLPPLCRVTLDKLLAISGVRRLPGEGPGLEGLILEPRATPRDPGALSSRFCPRPWEQHPPSSEAMEVEGLHLLSDCSIV